MICKSAVNGGWPDWSGETVVILGTGPSADLELLEPARGKAKVFAIKNSWNLARWADALYGLDRGWWIAHQGAPKFKGLKFSPSPTVCKVYPQIRQVKLKARAEILIRETGTVGCGLRTGGGHSGFQAINLAIQFGARRLLLVGFDMRMEGQSAHWHFDYRGQGRPDAKRIESWRIAFDECAPQFFELGIDVINCSQISALTAYPKSSLAAAI